MVVEGAGTGFGLGVSENRQERRCPFILLFSVKAPLYAEKNRPHLASLGVYRVLQCWLIFICHGQEVQLIDQLVMYGLQGPHLCFSFGEGGVEPGGIVM